MIVSREPCIRCVHMGATWQIQLNDLCLAVMHAHATSTIATCCTLLLLDCWKHCWICYSGWLEPLLNRIAENRSNVVAPIIDVLADDTLRYQFSSARSTSVGGFDWNLQFNWHAIPERERKRRTNEVDPVWLSFFRLLL